jgi:lycopene beta-cyclase
MPSMTARALHYVIVGGGLAGSLTALAVGERGRARVTVLEQDSVLGGNHTWSFHDGDLEREEHDWLAGLVSNRWPRYRIEFSGGPRVVEAGYATIESSAFAPLVTARLAARGVTLRLDTPVAAVGATEVRLRDGSVVNGDVVIDARGPVLPQGSGRGGFQKFVGLEVELSEDSPWDIPMLMDGSVPQEGGFRFVYVLPFSKRRVLIEDTVYADEPDLDLTASERAIISYGRAAGVGVTRVLRREMGVLPLPSHADAHPAASLGGPLAIGYRGGFFHPVTGYSLPLAVRAARAIAAAASAAEARAALATLASTLEPQRRFGHLLNRLTFEALPASARRGAFERFYRLPAPIIARFYASRSTISDRARILLGRPPAGISWRGLLGICLPQRAQELS